MGPAGPYEGVGSNGSGLELSSGEPRVHRLSRKRRESETSNDSREDGLMESDSSLVSSLEESLELCEPVKEYESKLARIVHS